MFDLLSGLTEHTEQKGGSVAEWLNPNSRVQCPPLPLAGFVIYSNPKFQFLDHACTINSQPVCLPSVGFLN